MMLTLLLLILSETSVKSEWVKKELEPASNREIEAEEGNCFAYFDSKR